MNDYMRESLSYFGLYKKMFQVKKRYQPVSVSYGRHKEQYFLYYEPEKLLSDKIIVWVHGGGWNAGNPKLFDFVGQCAAGQGYRFISLGYRLSPKYKYPCQIKDVCDGYNTAVSYLKERGINVSKIIAAGPSAGAHLASIMCYCRKVQRKYGVDISNIIGFIGSGGPYSFREDSTLTLKLLLDQLFKKGYDRRNGEPAALMSKNHIPMLLIQSRHDGLLPYACAEDMKRKADEVGNPCELYSVTDRKDTHSWYTAGMFLETREENKGLDKFFSWIEERQEMNRRRVFMKGTLYAVGVGPGDPELLTLKAVKTLKTADIIACPAKEAAPGLAYQIAQQACPFIASKEQMTIGFPMERGDLAEAHQEAADQIMQHLRSGKNVAFLTLGDPGFYSTFNYVSEIIRENGYETEVINGIPSFCAASARIKIPVASGSEAVLITSGEHCNFDGTLVIMKAGGRLQSLKEKISATEKSAYLIENCGMPDEKVYYGIQSMPEEAGYLSILFVK